jgi:Bax protein
MAIGSRGSKLFSALCLGAVIGGTVAMYATVLQGSRSPVDVVARPIAPAPSGAPVGLSGEDVATAARLDLAFHRMGYELDAIRIGAAEVPPLFLAQIPHDLDDLTDPDARKNLFLRVMLPLVLVANEEIAEDRARLLALVARKSARLSISREDHAWLKNLADRYDVEDGDMARLIARVDVVPPSLALAQSAEETGWGTSRLVRRSRNLFGQTADPAEEDSGMRQFGSLQEAVRAYLLNLNTHRAYDGLRRARLKARAKGRTLDGHQLADALRAYSERGEAYVGTIRSLIRRNDLVALDQAKLGRSVPVRLAAVGFSS